MITDDFAEINHQLALSEGLYELKDSFIRARSEPQFSEVFQQVTPLVSVCVATYNRPVLLIKRCIASLLRQTYRNIQIVVVGDHCTDDTEYTLAQIRDSRITFENLPERGPYPRPGVNRWRVAGTYAMNRALDLCEGSFISHLDDDDEATPERLEKLVRRALEKRLEFIWHKFFYQLDGGVWSTLGGDELQLNQVTTGSIFYHRFFSKIKWDVFAFRRQEPGDWNRIRKIQFLEPYMEFLNEALTIHYQEFQQLEFTAQRDESFLES